MRIVGSVLLCACALVVAGQTKPGPAPTRCRGMLDCGIVDSKLICGQASELPRLAEIATSAETSGSML
jgi:hypothetical protein